MSGVIGIVGGGRMGTGIAHAFLTAGRFVTLVDVDPDAALRARSEVGRLLDASAVRSGVASTRADGEARLTVTSEFGALEPAVLTIEAVPEILRLKGEVLSRVATVVSPSAVIATNTSSISVGVLSESVPGRERFIGMHFFNPVPASALVELVRHETTSESTVLAAAELVREIGKQSIVVGDSPGFASSRLGLILGLEAIRMLEAGVASAADIDAAMTLGYKHPVGPLRLTDIVGLDVRLDIAEYLQGELGDAFRPPQLLADMVAEGRLGKKSGRGFFEWPAD